MAAQIFKHLGTALPAVGAKLQKSVGGTIAFNVTGTAPGQWFLDLSKVRCRQPPPDHYLSPRLLPKPQHIIQSGTPSLTEGQGPKKADLTVTISDANFVKLAMGQMKYVSA